MVVREGEDSGPPPLDLFLAIGLDRKTAENTLANTKVTSNLTAVIKEAGVTSGCDRAVGNLLYRVATEYPSSAAPAHRPTLLEYVVSSKIKKAAQLDAAFSFLVKVGAESFELKEFEEACGVGVNVSLEEIESTVSAVLDENMDAIQHSSINVGKLCGEVRKWQPWADAKVDMIDDKLRHLLGEKTETGDKKLLKKKKEKPAKTEEEMNPFSIFPQPEENYKVHTEIIYSDERPKLSAQNTMELLKAHLEKTGGKVLTRFPPEPNGYLHIGHAKAMFIDFGLAKERNGYCYLRFDDTNPEAEKREYIDHIQEIVQWLGWKPFKVTYSSDYFQELYDLAVRLIVKGLAYVDHQLPEEIKEFREKKMNSPWRDRPISESLKLFDDMRRGLIEEGKATLRLKQDMQSDNKNMYDLIAYRIKVVHDYTHCIVDSLENITHSLEFEISRPSYYWLLAALELYQPYVWEYSRLNISNTLNRLVMEKWVDGWDDPRLMTLAGLRRRGVSSTAINTFIRGLGITRSDNSLISLDRLEYHIREELHETAPRMMVVLHPLKVVVTNLDKESCMELEAKMRPDKDDASSSYKVPFTNVIYIERSDFRTKDSKDYYGLAPGKSVLLRYAFPIKCTNVIYEKDTENVIEIHAEYDPERKTKPKGVLHWISQPSPGVEPLKVEVRLFEKLFLSQNPAELEDWLSDLNPHSKEVIPDAYAVPALANAVVGDKFQFERLGYFAVDPDSKSEKLLFITTPAFAASVEVPIVVDPRRPLDPTRPVCNRPRGLPCIAPPPKKCKYYSKCPSGPPATKTDAAVPNINENN
ncbi:hypothetical protein J5N97_001049 [Dioscorea zingiberensis]|uniref:glutamine--tRNA ligase n=1 Tax=Dioscorea zingiberensis TaxID=325984 RepID=A0A9D5BUQ1_9LILI|nr:hypothetical protein J5N97_001049 [Dioscorea zingiberensis]